MKSPGPKTSDARRGTPRRSPRRGAGRGRPRSAPRSRSVRRAARSLLNLRQEQVECLHLRCRGALGQHQRVHPGARPGDDLNHVGVGPLGRPVVDADRYGRRLETCRIVQRLHDALPGRLLDRGRHGVLQVQEQRVDGQRPCLRDEPIGRPRYCENRPPDGGAGAHVFQPTQAAETPPKRVQPTCRFSLRPARPRFLVARRLAKPVRATAAGRSASVATSGTPSSPEALMAASRGTSASSGTS